MGNPKSIAAWLVATLAAGSAVAPVLGDTVLFSSQSPGVYDYRAQATDNRWDPGDTITLTGLDQITGATSPNKFTVAFTPFSVTWTCIQQASGQQNLRIDSLGAAGTVSWGIQSGDPGAGTVTGPAYVPEAASILMFCGGLILLGGAVARSRRRQA